MGAAILSTAGPPHRTPHPPPRLLAAIVNIASFHIFFLEVIVAGREEKVPNEILGRFFLKFDYLAPFGAMYSAC